MKSYSFPNTNRRSAPLFLALGAFVGCVTLLQASPVSWNGGNGNWADANWTGGIGAAAPNMNGTDTAEISSGTVTFVPPGSDFQTFTGSTLTLNGGSWTQTVGNWSRFNDDLLLSNGSNFSRTAGGILVFGDDAGGNGSNITIGLTGGASLTHSGELWFGWAASGNDNLTVSMEINNGSVNAGGGGGADWWFWDVADNTNNYSVNFTGPGSITVGASGIRRQGSGGAESYQDLWNAGILQARGGNTGAFGDHFLVTGTPGSAGYTLTSAVPEPSTLVLTLGAAGCLLLRRRLRR